MVPLGINASDQPKVKEALGGPDNNKWLEDINIEEEYKTLTTAKTREEVESVGPWENLLPSHMVLQLKRYVNWQPAGYKGRLVA